jgi:hypothetical protein
MRTFIVSYDLASPANKGPIADAIMSIGDAWARPLDSLWYVRAEATRAEIEARIARHLEADDGLLIQEARGSAVMLNTTLRWFRQRRHEESEAAARANVVPFPAAPAASVAEADVAELDDDSNELPLLKAAS